MSEYAVKYVNDLGQVRWQPSLPNGERLYVFWNEEGDRPRWVHHSRTGNFYIAKLYRSRLRAEAKGRQEAVRRYHGKASVFREAGK